MLLNEKLFVHLSLNSQLLNNQLAKPEMESLLQRTAVAGLAAILLTVLGVVGFYHIQASDPYVKSVLSMNGDAVQGHAIFQMNCAGCHGVQAQGRVGPSLDGISQRKSRVRLIKQVISGQTPPMPQFQPSAQEMADLLNYLEKL